MFKSKVFYCKSCGSVGKTKRKMPGSLSIELLLWCGLIVPGLIYSLWRHSASKQVCRTCESVDVIPENSARAIKLKAAQ